jgi:hypothetical protein
MSASASERPSGEQEAAFVERDREPTRLGYGSGGVPLYVSLLWVAFIIVYIVVMSLIALPDLRAWMAR